MSSQFWKKMCTWLLPLQFTIGKFVCRPVNWPTCSIYFLETRLVLVGLSGSGKSATGNSIFRRDDQRSTPFTENALGTSVDDKCRYHKGLTSSGRDDVVVIDTPGLFEQDRRYQRDSKEVAKCMLLAAPGPTAFIFVIRASRLSDNQANVPKRIENLFGRPAKQ